MNPAIPDPDLRAVARLPRGELHPLRISQVLAAAAALAPGAGTVAMIANGPAPQALTVALAAADTVGLLAGMGLSVWLTESLRHYPVLRRMQARYGHDLRIHPDETANPRLVSHLSQLVWQVRRLERDGQATGLPAGEATRAFRSEAWQIGVLLRDAAQLRRRADACADEEAVAAAEATVAEVRAEAQRRGDALEQTLARIKRLAAGGDAGAVLSALARTRATLEASRAHQPAAELDLLTRAACDALATLEAGPTHQLTAAATSPVTS